VWHFVTKCTAVKFYKALNVEQFLQIEKFRIFHGRLEGQVLLATPTAKWPRGRPRTRWSGYLSDLAWSRLGVELAGLSEIVVDREIFQVILGLLLPRSSSEKKRVWKWMNEAFQIKRYISQLLSQALKIFLFSLFTLYAETREVAWHHTPHSNYTSTIDLNIAEKQKIEKKLYFHKQCTL